MDLSRGGRSRAVAVIRIGDRSFYPKRDCGETLQPIAEKGPIDFVLEKHETILKGKLPFDVGYDEEESNATLGDILLLNGNEIAVCFGDFSGRFALIGRIEQPVEKGLPLVFEDDQKASISMEWSE